MSAPNILLITADQLKYAALGCTGNAICRTPNIDRLASEGTSLDRAFVQNVICVPSRCSLMSGRYVHTHGAWSNRCALPDRETTVAQVLQQAGYHTALIGSNHIFRDPHFFGFETFDYYEWPWKPLDDAFPGHGLMRNAGASPYPAEESSSFKIADSVDRFVREERDRPYFIWASFFDPHPPYTPPAPYHAMYPPASIELPPSHTPHADNGRPPWVVRFADKHVSLTEDQWRVITANYYGQTSFFDEQVGRILGTLEETGQAENTVVVLTSDHGDFMGEHACHGKPVSFYDTLSHVPLIFRANGIATPGERRRGLVEQIDIFPTLCEFAGTDAPVGVQGASLLPLMRGECDGKDAVFSEAIVSGRMREDGRNNFGAMVRTETHKFSLFASGHEELYDLVNDPDEMRNLADDPAAAPIKADLSARLARWYVETQDQRPWASVPDISHDEWKELMNRPRSSNDV